VLVAALGLVAGVAPAASGQGQGSTVVADQLNNPRGLEFGGGALYVAEAGRGGDTCLAPDFCFGFTGSSPRSPPVGRSGCGS
jgi:hypothetical protein